MAAPAPEPTLQPGVAFHLMEDGSWKPEKLPPEVLQGAEFSGFLTIDGYRCSVFEAYDGSEWAQKSVNTQAAASPEPDMSARCPECGGRAVDVRAMSACCPNGHFFGVKPKAASAFVEPSVPMSSVASRVAARWLAQQNVQQPQHKCAACASFAWHGATQEPVRRADGVHHPSCPRLAGKPEDVVSQVSEILNGGKGDDDKYDDDIAKWCEKVVEKMPEMQEIFDTAFHEVMDFKSKMPASDNPRVRQIADEKVAEMLSQAAARIEIISHGLHEEVEALCAGLAAGAGAAPEEEAPKTASSPRDVARELAAIAAAINASRSPDASLVTLDLREVLASLG